MYGDLYIKMEDVWMPTTMEQVEAVYEKKQAQQKNECYVTYAKELLGGHLTEMHYGVCSATHPDGCTYCAAGFSMCVVCGAADYDQTWPHGSLCSGRRDIILLAEVKDEHCCTCDSKVYEALHKVYKFEMGSNTRYMQPCTFCVKCGQILAEDREHYVEDGVKLEYPVPF